MRRRFHLAHWLPAPYRMDPRSLAAFRWALSAYFAQDLYYRLRDGRVALSWYISETSHAFSGNLPPIVDPDDVDRGLTDFETDYWCHRGTALHQVGLFALTIILVVFFASGVFLGRSVPLLLWASAVGMVCRTPEAVQLNDVGDTLGCHYLLWAALLPKLNAVASVNPIGWWRRWRRLPNPQQRHSTQERSDMDDALLAHRKKFDSDDGAADEPCHPASPSKTLPPPQQPTQRVYRHLPVNSLACLGIALQISLCYLGTYYGRLPSPFWWYPDYSAVYKAFSTLMYTRPHMAALAQAYPQVMRLLCAGTIFVEVGGPVLCFLAPYDVYAYDPQTRTYHCTWKSWRHWPALAVVAFHLLLWVCIRIPSLQILFAGPPLLYLPGSFWDDCQDYWQDYWCSTPRVVLRGKDDSGRPVLGSNGRHRDTSAGTSDGTTDAPGSSQRRLEGVVSWSSSFVRNVAVFFLIPCMLTSFVSAMDWFPRAPSVFAPRGPLKRVYRSLYIMEERLHFAQYFQIFKGPPTEAMHFLLVGQYDDNDTAAHKDLLAALHLHDWSNRTDISSELYQERLEGDFPTNMSAQFRHWRLEAFITENQWDVTDNNRQALLRLGRYCNFLCVLANQELQKLQDPRRLTMVKVDYLLADIAPMDDPRRFIRKPDWDTGLVLGCFDDEEDGNYMEPEDMP
jgi:hypothetical protein